MLYERNRNSKILKKKEIDDTIQKYLVQRPFVVKRKKSNEAEGEQPIDYD